MDILFRGYNTETELWIYGAPVNTNIIYTNKQEISVKTVLQYSGKSDIKNKKIFEGDIIVYGDNDLYNQIGEVKFENGAFIVCGPFGIYHITDRWIRNPKVIGNNIENSDIILKLKEIAKEHGCTIYLDNTYIFK